MLANNSQNNLPHGLLLYDPQAKKNFIFLNSKKKMNIQGWSYLADAT